MARPLSAEYMLLPRSRSKRNIIFLVGYVVFLAVLIVVHARVFQYLMATYEGQPNQSFVDGLYWTITTMTTLGFGDITFLSGAGRLFSAWVTLSGFAFLLVLLPFGIISVVFAPWLEKILRYRPKTQVKRGARGHVIMAGWDRVTEALARGLMSTRMPYLVMLPDVEEVRRLEEARFNVVHGDPTDAKALKRVRVEAARMVIGNMSDPDNANLVLTVKSVCETPVAVVVTHPERAELMRIAGASHVVALREVLGNYLAVRATTRGTTGHVVDTLGNLIFAEIPAHVTPYVGRRLRETGIREKSGVSVIGVWERGRFSLPEPDTVIMDNMVLLLVGSYAALETLEGLIGREGQPDELVVIVGHGTVGSASASFLRRRQVPHVIIEHDARPGQQEAGVITGDASDQRVLRAAGIERAGGLIITTNDDGTNVFLTLAGRHINPHVRIVSRANREENVAELYAAGADFVVSHSSVGASILTNMIEGRQNVFLSEGVQVFRRQVPEALHGHTLASSRLRSLTGATAVAIQRGRDDLMIDLTPTTVLDRDTALFLVGSPESEDLFSRRFGKEDTKKRRTEG